MKKVFFALLVIIGLSSSAVAKYVTPLSGPGVDVDRVFIHSSGAISIYITGETLNLDQCKSTFRVFIPHDLPGKDAMLSTALFAYASGKKIGIHGSGCSTTSFWGGTVDVPIVNNLWVF